MRTFAKRLNELRQEKGLSIMALGMAIDVSDATVCRWENGISDIKSDQLVALAKYYDVTANYLLGIEDRYKILQKNRFSKTVCLLLI